MTKRKSLVVPAVLAGIVFLVIAVVYWAETAHGLPSFFPGHSATPTNHHHVKHGIASFVVAIGCFVFAWFQTGPSNASTSAQT